MPRLQRTSGRRSLWHLPICAVLILDIAGTTALPGQETAVATACAGTPVEVSARDTGDRQLLCASALQAMRFFSRLGWSLQQILRINVPPETEGEEASIEIGKYDCASGEVTMMPFAAFRRRFADKGLFRSPVSPTLYRSFGVHEIAHAIAEENAQGAPVPWLAQEYIAAVAQFATMEPNWRTRILARYPVPAFDTPESMSGIYYQMDPSAFAIKSYLHYVSLEDSPSFLQDLLTGEVELGDDDEWW